MFINTIKDSSRSLSRTERTKIPRFARNGSEGFGMTKMGILVLLQEALWLGYKFKEKKYDKSD
jgi:hypothetical protein